MKQHLLMSRLLPIISLIWLVGCATQPPAPAKAPSPATSSATAPSGVAQATMPAPAPTPLTPVAAAPAKAPAPVAAPTPPPGPPKDANKSLATRIGEGATAIGNAARDATPDFSGALNKVKGLVRSDGPKAGTPKVGAAPPAKETSRVVRVFYATDRRPLTTDSTSYGGDRGTISRGSIEVSVPTVRQVGEVEKPGLLDGIVAPPNPDKFMLLKKARAPAATNFYAEMKAAKAEGGTAFIFIHGYNVSFEDAALRTAQIAVDLDIGAVPVFYSWPSQNSIFKYTVDEANAEWTEPHLRDFLGDFADKSGVETIYVIAHSMGTRAATRSLAALLEARKDLVPRFREVILAAPDIDAEVFKENIAPRFAALGKPLTLYASSKDNALAASRQVHGLARAGDSGRGLVLVNGVETIDASNLDTSLLGHSYYSSTRTILSDLSQLLKNGMRAAERTGLAAKQLGSAVYWEFKK